MANKLGRIPLGNKVNELGRIYGVIEREITREMALMDIGNYEELRAIKTQENIDGLIKTLELLIEACPKDAVLVIPQQRLKDRG